VTSKQIQDVRPVPTTCAGTPSADTTVYDSTQVSERAAPRSVPRGEYPAAAREQKIQGRAVVAAVVNGEGHVDTTSITLTTSGNALLDAEARRIVSLARFWPACRDGVAVRSRIVVPFDFKLTGNSAAVGFGVLTAVWVGVMAGMMN
jgi:TonB family protein